MNSTAVVEIDLTDPDTYEAATRYMPDLAKGTAVRLIPGNLAVDRRVITALYWAEPSVIQVTATRLSETANVQSWRNAIANYTPPDSLPVAPDRWDMLAAKHASETPAFLAAQARKEAAE